MRELWGYFLVGIGVIFVLATYSGIELGMDKLWPAFLLIPAVGFHIYFFANPNPKRAGVLVPGGILLVYAPLFFFSQLFFHGDMSKTWPIFLLGPALGLAEMYVFGGRKTVLLIPISILTVVAFIFLSGTLLSTHLGGVLGFLFLASGVYLLTQKKKDHV